jgi:hypothetical protein
MRHHTKTKGDIGVAKSIADLTGKGFDIMIPLSEHLPFDLVIYKNMNFQRVQVKYTSMRNNIINVDGRGCWVDKHSLHIKKPNRSEIDIICAYCPELDKCFYVPIEKLPEGGQIILRLNKTKKNQKKRINFAKDYTMPL